MVYIVSFPCTGVRRDESALPIWPVLPKDGQRISLQNAISQIKQNVTYSLSVLLYIRHKLLGVISLTRLVPSLCPCKTTRDL